MSSASLRFCRQCANLLYPQADPVNKTLMYACRNCTHSEEATVHQRERGDKWLVYRNDLMAETKESAGVTQDLQTDPTLPRSKITCPRCGHGEAVFFQDQSKRHLSTMTLFYVCTGCNYEFQDPSLQEAGNR